MKLSALQTQYSALQLKGKQAVVVGGTSGIGMGIALRLSQAQANVTIVGRNESRGLEIVEEMKERARKGRESADTPAAGDEPTFEFVKCDAQLLKNVKSFSDAFKESHGHVDYLVLSQGIATIQGRTETAEGLDQKLALHYYSRVAFVTSMLPMLNGSRVLSVLSGGVHGAYAKYDDDVELKSNYSIKNAADAAGFYGDIGLDSLSRENPNVTFIHSAPGFVNTNWGTEMPVLIKGFLRVIQPLFAKSTDNCAEFMCEALFNEDLKAGFHVRSPTAEVAKPVTLHEKARPSVWAHTCDVLKRVLG